MKKIMIIVLIVLLILGGIGFVVFKTLFPNQIKLQYDNETISKYKRTLDFSVYKLDEFEARYEELKPFVIEQSIEKIQSSLLAREFSAEELAMFYLYRIREFEAYNTVIELNPNIIEEAKALDEKIRDGEVESLFGVMVLIKDNIADKSMYTAAGAYVLKDLTTSRDAHLVSSLKEDDALILGKANLSEWSNFMSMPSSNGYSTLGGQTKNAYGKYDVGGSSSGSSSSAGLNLATITIGTETAGSLIHPAGQNSVVAIKPTLGLISRDLIIPIAEAQDTAGIIGRNISDVYKVFSNIVNVDEHDEATKIANDIIIKDVLEVSSIKRIGVVNSDSEEMKAIIKEFETMGIEVVNVELGKETGIDMMSVLEHGIVKDLESFLTNAAVISSIDSLKEVVDFNNAKESVMAFGQSYLEGSLKKNHKTSDIEAIIEKNKMISRKILDDVMKKYDVQILLSISNELSGIYAPAGYPALTIPSGYRANGEPYGLTLVGGYLGDLKLMEMGLMYENYTSHRVLPTKQ